MKFSDYGKWVKLFALSHSEEKPISVEDDSLESVITKASTAIRDEETHYLIIKKYINGKEEYFLRADQKDTRWVIDLFDYRTMVSSGSTHYWCGLNQLDAKLQELIFTNSL